MGAGRLAVDRAARAGIRRSGVRATRRDPPGDSMSEVLHAGSFIAGNALDLDLLVPAAEAAIVELDLQTLRFRHPLIRSAVRQSASAPQRRRVHEALAETLEAEPDRRVWHRAALITEAHEDVTLELEEAGRRALRRGALHVAITALAAAELSDPAHQGRRLLSAGELAVELGQPELAAPLLREVDEQNGPVERALATWIEEMINPPDLGDAERVARVVDAVERAGDAGDRDLHVRLLWLAVSRAWWTDPGPAARRILVDAARRLGGSGHRDARVLAVYACADPVGHAAEALPRLQAVAATRTLDTESVRHLGPAALALGAFDVAVGLLASAADGARTEGQLGHRHSRRRGGAAARDGARWTALDRGRRDRPLPGRRDARRRRRGRARRCPRRAAGPGRRRQGHRSPSSVLPRAQRVGRAGTTTHTRRPGGCSTRPIRRTTRSWAAGSSPTSRRPPSTPTASPRRQSC